MNCALTILLPNFSCGHDASCPYITILSTFWVTITYKFLCFSAISPANFIKEL